MGRRAPQAPSAGTRFGVQAGSRSAWSPRISGAGRALSACPVPSSIRRPVSGVSVQGPRVRCPRVQCPVSGVGVRVSAVRCGRPVSGVQLGVRASGHPASAIRAFPRLRCPNRVSSSSAPMRREPHGEDGRSRRGRPARYPRPAGRLPESEPDARSWRRPCWANGGVGLAVIVGRSSASGQAVEPGRPGGAGCAGTAHR